MAFDADLAAIHNPATNTAPPATWGDQINDNMAAIGGAWTSFTPQLDQGATTNIANTVNYSKYVKAGRWVTWSFALTVIGAGTAGAAIFLTLPVTSAASTFLMLGPGHVGDTSGGAGGAYFGLCQLQGTTQIGFRVNGSSGFVGASPSFALANTDALVGTVTYEAAS